MKTKSMFQIEIERAFQSKGFKTSFAIGLLLALLDSVHHFLNVYEGMKWEIAQGVTWYNASTAYNQWISVNGHWSATVFYLVFPILAVLPHATSYLQDKKSGYIKNILLRTSSKKYFMSKYFAVFLSGGAAVVIPVLINFLIVTLYMPLRQADLLISVVTGTSALVELYYSNTFLYTTIYFVLTFLCAGAFATISLVVACKSDYYFTTLVAPFVCAMVLYNFAVPFNLNGLAPFLFLQIIHSAGVDVYHSVGLIISICVFTYAWFVFVESKHEIL